MGSDGFLWFFAKVENRDDPLSLGRVQIRVFGVHPDDTTLVPIESLPWAMPIQPITSAGAYGVGCSPVGPLPGSHVFGFWLDSKDKQIPVFIGTIAGGTGQFTLGEQLGNAITDFTNVILPSSNSSVMAKAVDMANILRNTFG